MVSISTRRIVTALACFILVGLLPASAAAQTSTFVIDLTRTGTPGTEQVTILDPQTLQPVLVTRDTGAFDNPCTLELVDVSGSSTIATTQSVDKFGNLKVAVGVTSTGTGSGWLPAADGSQLFTGATYVFTENQQFTFRLPAIGVAFSSDFTDKLVMKGNKSTDNWILRANFRIKVSETGQVQVLLIKTNEGVCKG